MSMLKLYTPPAFLSVFAPDDDDEQPVILRFPTGEAVGRSPREQSSRNEARRAVAYQSESHTADAVKDGTGSGRVLRIDNGHVERIRAIRKNRVCPACHRVHVEPVSIGPRLRNRDQMPVPGASTLVGFRCCECEHEWTL